MMQRSDTACQRTAETEWVQTAPYTAMLRDYETAAARLRNRITELTEELKAAEKSKAGTQDSARAQTLLEQRIDTLRHEYIDTQSVMQQIRVYAEKEGVNESREAAAGCQGKRVCAGF